LSEVKSGTVLDVRQGRARVSLRSTRATLAEGFFALFSRHIPDNLLGIKEVVHEHQATFALAQMELR
jgi:hypothetical protein